MTTKKNELQNQEALQTYHYEDASRKQLVKYTEQKYAHIDGLGDCIRYGIHHLFPITHDTLGLPEYIGMDSKYQAMTQPGRQYMPESPLYPGGPSWEEIMNGTEEKDYMVY